MDIKKFVDRLINVVPTINIQCKNNKLTFIIPKYDRKNSQAEQFKDLVELKPRFLGCELDMESLTFSIYDGQLENMYIKIPKNQLKKIKDLMEYYKLSSI